MNKNLPSNESSQEPKEKPIKDGLRSKVYRFDQLHYYSHKLDAPRHLNGKYGIKSPHFFMLFVLEGRISIQTNDEDNRWISQGEFFCTYHDAGKYRLAIEPGPQHVVTLIYNPTFIHKETAKNELRFPSILPVIEALLNHNKGVSSLPVLKFPARMARQLEELVALDPNKKASNVVAQSLVLDIVQQYHHGVCAAQQHPSLTLAELVKVYIDQNLSNPQLQLQLLSEHFHASARTLQRKFQRAYGYTLKSYITKQRMDKAAQLLRDGVALADVLHAVGYVDQHSFSVQFKKYHSYAPSFV
ncbi:helix-turn-helix transcriptional regulator [Olivibacter sp. SDN3]|uniref:helix-turn-helix transcriptional regulator n=1 Tax=Olivibacter sp. SDN3 TaxID=2764720 RepID=UPI00165141DB|nr:AraC family transcriptional regulator [Olivibacter sp. SDN3]QNL48151.1 helix-turn-helix transcriptional regulator [Olivibacter sp. SDN3]